MRATFIRTPLPRHACHCTPTCAYLCMRMRVCVSPRRPGRAGELFSDDDFYLLSSGLVLLETTNHIYRPSVYQVRPRPRIDSCRMPCCGRGRLAPPARPGQPRVAPTHAQLGPHAGSDSAMVSPYLTARPSDLPWPGPHLP